MVDDDDDNDIDDNKEWKKWKQHRGKNKNIHTHTKEPTNELTITL